MLNSASLHKVVVARVPDAQLGTTTAAFEYLDHKDARGIFATAIDAAEKRAAELAREASNES